MRSRACCLIPGHAFSGLRIQEMTSSPHRQVLGRGYHCRVLEYCTQRLGLTGPGQSPRMLDMTTISKWHDSSRDRELENASLHLKEWVGLLKSSESLMLTIAFLLFLSILERAEAGGERDNIFCQNKVRCPWQSIHHCIGWSVQFRQLACQGFCLRLRIIRRG